MSEELKATISRLLVNAWSEGDLDALGELYADDLLFHRPGQPAFKDLDEYETWISETRKAFPDFEFTVDDIIVEESKAAVRWTVQGTHTGQSEMYPFPTTGKSINMSGGTFYKMEGGKLVEAWHYPDNMGVMQQLGLIPAMG